MFEQPVNEMVWQTHLHFGVVFSFAVCVCLVGITNAAAKCVPEMCGDLEVSYPFWINNSDCGYPGFQIIGKKDNKTGMMAAFFRAYLGNIAQEYLPGYDYKIMDIDYKGHLVINSTSIKAYSCNDTLASNVFQPPPDGPFTISMSNKFLVVGCKTVGTYVFGELGDARCVSTCVAQSDPPYCRYGCCEITLPDNWSWLNFTGGGVFTIDGNENCGFSTILDPSTFKVVDNGTNLFWGSGRKAYYGLRLNWGIGLQNCSAAKSTLNYSCDANAECIDGPSGEGHVCTCLPGYEGNGYLNGTGCIDIDECSNKTLNGCVGKEEGGICHNFAGSYACNCTKGNKGNGYSNGSNCKDIDECGNSNERMCVEDEKGGMCHNFAGFHNCSCATGYKGDGLKDGSRCTKSESSSKTTMVAAIGSVSALLGVCLAACGIVWLLRVRYLKHARDEYFRSNGGNLLLESILGKKGEVREGKIFRIFSEKELKSASRNYSDEMKLGSGGSSTVYKGILSDQTAVAIKKFKDFSIGVETEEAIRQFINEIDILSGLHHKNVVNLVGCCLQTQSPLLVYEFVDGGTISHQLRNGRLPWQSRLHIAMGSADALAYLHSKSIIHRDVKSSNILLDNTITPKVADFGISRLLCGNDTHLSTNIMGTHGYMDPEYFDTGTLTDRSDVYSFGVFLVELLTGREPLSPGKPQQEIVLSKFFVLKCKEHCLTDILDRRVKNEENLSEMTAVANLAKECLSVEGSERPSMREVKRKLEEIGGSATLTSTISYSNVIDLQISSGPTSGSMNSLFQLTDMSRINGR